jgi:putative flippase GtrA
VSAFLRFALVGIAGFIVNEAALWIALHVFHLGKDAGWFFSFVPAVTFTWWGNRSFTFREHASRGASAAFREWLRFVVTNSFGALVNLAVYEVLIHFAAADPPLALACGVLAGLAFNFTLSKKLVFRKPSASGER